MLKVTRVFVLHLALIFSFMGITQSIHAQLKKRAVKLEWEAVEDAKGYELKLTPKLSDVEKVLKKTKKSKWIGKLVPGTYVLEIRSYDDRGVPGEWSESVDFVVNLKAPVKVAPKKNIKFDPDQKDSAQVVFKWKSVEGASEYLLKVYNSKGELVNSEKTTELTKKLSLQPKEDYKWSISSLLADGSVDEKESKWSFSINEMGLEAPVFTPPKKRYVQKLQWSKPVGAKHYKYLLKVKNPKTKRWVSIFRKNKVTKNTIAFDYSKPSGRYKAYIQAFDGEGKKSKLGMIEFDAEGGMRSPAALNNALMRETIKKKKPWYAIASYFLTMIDYKSTNVDAQNDANFNGAISGTGRVGVGYQKPDKDMGYFAIVDFGGMVIGGENYTFASAELHATKNHILSNGIQLTYSGGLYSKEFLQVLKPQTTGAVVGSVNKLSTMGAHAGIGYWQPFTLTYGMQFNARVYIPVAGSMPDGDKLNFDPSFKLGLLGYKRLSENAVGYMGYSLMQDKISYEATDGVTTGVNSVETLGHYLNLKYEYSF